ncbi:MAG TPA: DUF6457 domain-containing protein [Glaciihabitans sp.]|jgi:hypothetical protein|nr:DUF6457 domain-containing protein [Glaciihabitans sp.]
MSTANNDDRLLAWTRTLATQLGVEPSDIDINGILGLAGRAAHGIVRPAAPLTTYIVGYAAGYAAALGDMSPAEAYTRAADTALRTVDLEPDNEQTN